ncbi:hypothetical protein [Flavobacterium sp.]|uniref:hypothetical protein n=1 Tax=Flavobacterium sp. TaxID=239 RepID=UPI0025E495F8|nr:hypothetical protein [Flavobacterium sp.]
MKALFCLLSILVLTVSQAQKYDCALKTKEYQELLKAKNFTGSYEVWNEVIKKCPKDSETLYQDGLTILQYKIDNAANAEEKEKLVRGILTLYDQFYTNFPKAIPYYEVSKAMTLHHNQIGTKNEILALLESGFAKAAKEVKDANAIYTFFSLCHEKYNAGESQYNADSTLDKYVLVNALLTDLQNSETQNTNDYKTAQRGINALAKDLVTCDNLESYFQKKFNINKENEAWLITALTNMAAKCSAKPVFSSMAEKLYSLKASSKSAYFMALATLKQRKFEESVTYYNQAADLETNPQEKAKIYFTLGTGLLANDMAKSKETLNKALQFDPKMGRAYLFIAQLYSYSAEECGKTDFEKKAVFTLAAQTAQKAAIADPKLKAAADKMAEDFAPQALTASEISKEKMNGKTLTIGCWINETITFPVK